MQTHFLACALDLISFFFFPNCKVRLLQRLLSYNLQKCCIKVKHHTNKDYQDGLATSCATPANSPFLPFSNTLLVFFPLLLLFVPGFGELHQLPNPTENEPAPLTPNSCSSAVSELNGLSERSLLAKADAREGTGKWQP